MPSRRSGHASSVRIVRVNWTVLLEEQQRRICLRSALVAPYLNASNGLEPWQQGQRIVATDLLEFTRGQT
jgi:hypothetical protein